MASYKIKRRGSLPHSVEVAVGYKKYRQLQKGESVELSDSVPFSLCKEFLVETEAKKVSKKASKKTSDKE